MLKIFAKPSVEKDNYKNVFFSDGLSIYQFICWEGNYGCLRIDNSGDLIRKENLN